MSKIVNSKMIKASFFILCQHFNANSGVVKDALKELAENERKMKSFLYNFGIEYKDNMRNRCFSEIALLIYQSISDRKFSSFVFDKLKNDCEPIFNLTEASRDKVVYADIELSKKMFDLFESKEAFYAFIQEAYSVMTNDNKTSNIFEPFERGQDFFYKCFNEFAFDCAASY